MKRLLVLILVLCMVLVVFVGCTPKDATDTGKSDTSDADDLSDASDTSDDGDMSDADDSADSDVEEKEAVTLEVWIVTGDWVDAWPEMKASFEEEYPWITLNSVGTGSEEGFLASRIAANDIPDIISVDNITAAFDAVDAGLIQDISDLEVLDDVAESYRNVFEHNGKVFGITQGAAFACMYYNMAALNEAGWDAPPSNYDELLQCAKDVDEKTDFAPITVSGDFGTTCWMVYEAIIANEAAQDLGLGVYEEQFKDGKLDFASYTDATRKFDEISNYFLSGSALNTAEDVVASMSYGNSAMAIAGNWSAKSICDAIAEQSGGEGNSAVTLIPFNDSGDPTWVSMTPETGFGMSGVDEGEAVTEARYLFMNWLFQPENFKIIQNTRGTVPVLTSLEDDQIILPDAIKGVLPDMNAAPFVLMGFNLFTAEFSDVACTSIRDVISGNMSAEDAVDAMTNMLSTSYRNQ